MIVDPGWRYSEDFDREALRPTSHFADVASGRLDIAMEDGTEAEVGAGEVVDINPGHDAWTVGDEPCVFLDVREAIVLPDRSA